LTKYAVVSKPVSCYDLIQGYSKFPKEEEQIETLKKILLQISNDIENINIKKKEIIF
jgi:hypothetical protein